MEQISEKLQSTVKLVEVAKVDESEVRFVPCVFASRLVADVEDAFPRGHTEGERVTHFRAFQPDDQ